MIFLCMHMGRELFAVCHSPSCPNRECYQEKEFKTSWKQEFPFITESFKGKSSFYEKAMTVQGQQGIISIIIYKYVKNLIYKLKKYKLKII